MYYHRQRHITSEWSHCILSSDIRKKANRWTCSLKTRTKPQRFERADSRKRNGTVALPHLSFHIFWLFYHNSNTTGRIAPDVNWSDLVIYNFCWDTLWQSCRVWVSIPSNAGLSRDMWIWGRCDTIIRHEECVGLIQKEQKSRDKQVKGWLIDLDDNVVDIGSVRRVDDEVDVDADDEEVTLRRGLCVTRLSLCPWHV